jgi:hypothetical protein
LGGFLFIVYDLSNELIGKIKELGKITQAERSHALVCHQTPTNTMATQGDLYFHRRLCSKSN